ncbi:MAG: hypothetical protein OXI01_21810 [Albidovulum sp.]|nr:hypothetical protein [Albidovulum sp.]
MVERLQNSGDDALRLAVLAVVGSFAAAAMAQSYQQEAMGAAAAAAWIHIRPCSTIAHFHGWLLNLAVVGPWLFAPCAAADAFLVRNGIHELNAAHWMAVQTVAGRVAAVCYAVPLAWLAWRSRRLRPDLAFRVRHTLDSLAFAQSETMRTSRICRREEEFADSILSPADSVRTRIGIESEPRDSQVGAGRLLNAVPEPVAPKPWVSALRPEDWIICQGIGTGRLRLSTSATSRRARRHWDAITIDDASEAFEAQLGPVWRGIERLPPVERALAAVFANFFGYRYSAGGDILNALGSIAGRQSARNWQMRNAIGDDRRLTREVATALSSRSGGELARRTRCHGWEYTAFIAMLEAARKDRGIVASASFGWLKKENRRLWYVLNNAHSSACCAEAAMVCAHFRAEVQIGRPLYRPAAFQASRSLVEEYLDSRPERIKARKAQLLRDKKIGRELEEFALSKAKAVSSPTASRVTESGSC